MDDTRADIAVETLLKIVLGLVVVWLVLEIIETFLRITFGLFGAVFALLRPVVVLLIVVLIVLWLLDRI